MLGGTEMPSCTPFFISSTNNNGIKNLSHKGIIRVFFTIVNSNRKNKPFKFRDVNNITEIRIDSDHLAY